MKFTKKLLSLLLSTAMLFTITAGIDLSAYAAGWADYAQEIELNTVYSESASTSDFTTGQNHNFMGDDYYDSFVFRVPSKGKVIISLESEDYHYFSHTDYFIYKSDNLNNYINGKYEISRNFSSGTGLYYGSLDISLPQGTYYLLVRYQGDIVYTGYQGAFTSSYNFFLSYQPNIATPTLKATVNANGTFKLSWNKVSGADKYELYIKQADGSYKLMKTTTGTSFTTATAAYGKQYTYKMRAVKGNTKSAYSNVVNAKNTKKLQTPSAKVTVNANGSFTLSWNKVAGATRYGIYMLGADGKYSWIKSTNATSWTTGTAQYGKKYTYKVFAVNDNNKSVASNFSSAFSATNNKKLQTPSLKVAVNKNGSFKLSWGKVTGATSYQIYMKQSNGSYKLIKTTTSTSFTTAVAAKGKTYSYKVKAVTSKHKHATSNYSNVVSAKRK